MMSHHINADVDTSSVRFNGLNAFCVTEWTCDVRYANPAIFSIRVLCIRAFVFIVIVGPVFGDSISDLKGLTSHTTAHSIAQ